MRVVEEKASGERRVQELWMCTLIFTHLPTSATYVFQESCGWSFRAGTMLYGVSSCDYSESENSTRRHLGSMSHHHLAFPCLFSRYTIIFGVQRERTGRVHRPAVVGGAQE